MKFSIKDFFIFLQWQGPKYTSGRDEVALVGQWSEYRFMGELTL